MNQQKKIIHLRSTFHPGGTENLIVRLFNEPTDRYKIILVLMKPGKMMHDLSSELNEVVHLYRKGKADFRFLFSLINLIKKEKPDGIHTHQEIELIYAFLVKLRFPKIRLYHHVHLHNPTHSFWFFIERMICNIFVTRVLAVSNTLRNYLIINGFHSSKISMIYNIVSRTNKLNEEFIEDFSSKIKHENQCFVIGMIGNFVEDKDQQTLAMATKELLLSGYDIQTVFIGSPGTTIKQSMDLFSSEEIDQKVFFTGPIANASELIPLFNLMVFSSKRETFGIAAIESLLYKIPVIASDIAVMKELSQEGKYFELFKTGDFQGLAELIKKQMGLHPDRTHIESACEYALHEFSAKRYIQQLAEVYSS